LPKKPHLTNKKYIRRSLKNLFANVRPWICIFAICSKKSQPYPPVVLIPRSLLTVEGRRIFYHLKIGGGPPEIPHNLNPKPPAQRTKKTPTMSGQYGIPDWTNTSSAPAPAVVEETSSSGWAASGGENFSAANNPNAGGVGNAPR
jgi:hypothetical protein